MFECVDGFQVFIVVSIVECVCIENKSGIYEVVFCEGVIGKCVW